MKNRWIGFWVVVFSQLTLVLAQTERSDVTPTFEQGGIDIYGNNATRSDRIRTGLIAVDGTFAVQLSGDYRFNFFYYRQDGSFDYRDSDVFLSGRQQRTYSTPQSQTSDPMLLRQ